MPDEKDTAEPSAASAGSLVCPYVTGTVTRYCTLTPFTLTDAEREAIYRASQYLSQNDVFEGMAEDAATLRGLLERLG